MSLSDAQLDVATTNFIDRFGVQLWDAPGRPTTQQIKSAFAAMDAVLDQTVGELNAIDPDKTQFAHAMDAVSVPMQYELWMLAEILRQRTSTV